MYSAGSKVKDQCEKMYNYHVQLFQLSLEVYLFVPGKPEQTCTLDAAAPA